MHVDESDMIVLDDDDPVQILQDDAEDAESAQPNINIAAWKLLVVDDDPEIHTVTRLVLQDTVYRSRELRILSAMNAAEAEDILRDQDDIAMILLDVVMETDDAGLRLVKRIRRDLRNESVRIVLRTGQPGQAPERKVIVDYDINDYKSKTELTAQKLFTAVVAGLRSFEHLRALELSRRGLEKVIAASASLQQRRSMEMFSTGVLTQMSALLNLDIDAILCAHVADGTGAEIGEPVVIAAAGRYEECLNLPTSKLGDEAVTAAITKTLERKSSIYEKESFTLWIETPNQRKGVVFVRASNTLSEVDRQLIEVFCSNISVGYDNVYLFEQLRKSHEAAVVALADLAEYKDTDTGQHVLRVYHSTNAITQQLRQEGHFADEIDDFFVELVGMASILHDVGKIAIPDMILQKPGPLEEGERVIMEKHASIGGGILEKAGKMVDGVTYMSLGAEIAEAHHEKFDGSGYPKGLKGEEIPLSARIVAVADVFDALTHRRPYKEPWPIEKAVEAMRDGKGTHFDPVILETFLGMVRRDPSFAMNDGK